MLVTHVSRMLRGLAQDLAMFKISVIYTQPNSPVLLVCTSLAPIMLRNLQIPAGSSTNCSRGLPMTLERTVPVTGGLWPAASLLSFLFSATLFSLLVGKPMWLLLMK